MSIELARSELTKGQAIQLTLLLETLTSLMMSLTPAQARSYYRELEQARDALSYLLDKADGKR